MLSQLGYDVRHALRGLLRDRAFTLVALLSIGWELERIRPFSLWSIKLSSGSFR